MGEPTKNSGFKTFLASDKFVHTDVNYNFELLDSMRLPAPVDGACVQTDSVVTSNAFARSCEWKTITYNDKWFESYGIINLAGVTLPLQSIVVPKPDSINIKKIVNLHSSFNATSASTATGSTLSNSDLAVLVMPMSSTASVTDLEFKMVKVNCSDNLTVSGQLFITMKGETS